MPRGVYERPWKKKNRNKQVPEKTISDEAVEMAPQQEICANCGRIYSEHLKDTRCFDYSNDKWFPNNIAKDIVAARQKNMKTVSGASSSHAALRYDLIPRAGLEVLARQFTIGVPIHGERNFMLGIKDEDFIRERLNHIYEHVIKLVHPQINDKEIVNFLEDGNASNIGDIVRNNLGAIMWGCCFLAEVLEDKTGYAILLEKVLDFKSQVTGTEHINR
jgi:hypothetical protein